MTTGLGEHCLTCIICVVFRNNQLRDLPAELVSLHLLRELTISYNRYDLVVDSS